MSVGTIYKITCLINQKEYIGQTIKSVDERLRRHETAAKVGRSTHLGAAIRKYTIENFVIEPIWQCSSNVEDLDYWEKHFIEERQSLTHGYNLTIGGRGTRNLKTKEKLDHKGNKLPMYITNSHGKKCDGYKVRDHPEFRNMKFKSIDYTSEKLSMDEKLQMAMNVLEQLNNGTFVDDRDVKLNRELGVQKITRKGQDVGYQVGFNCKIVKTFGSKEFTMEEKLAMANKWSLENHHLYPTKESKLKSKK